MTSPGTFQRIRTTAAQLHPVAWVAIAALPAAIALGVMTSDVDNDENVRTIVGLVIWVFLLAIYFLPTIAALGTKHPQATSVAIINLLLGWTLIGWVVALVMSQWQRPAVPVAVVSTPPPQPVQDLAARLARLDELAAAGVITDEERQRQRTALIERL